MSRGWWHVTGLPKRTPGASRSLIGKARTLAEACDLIEDYRYETQYERGRS